MPKRRKDEDAGDDENPTPRKLQKDDKLADSPGRSSPGRPSASVTPSKRKSILKSTPSKLNGYKSVEATPSSLRKVLFSTAPECTEQATTPTTTPTALRNDRSARRTSQRTLQQGAFGVEDSEGEDDVRDEALAEAILAENGVDEDSDEDEDEDIMDIDSVAVTSATPSKSGRPRGRPRGRRRERTPSPPPDLPPHELYFFQNRAGANKTSANTMSPQTLLNHDDYFAQMKDHKESHLPEIEQLKQLHNRAFDQWRFELEEGFNLCLYGYGTKRNLIMDFAEHLYYASSTPPKIVVVNGYTPGLAVRDILITLAGVVLPRTAKLPAQPLAILELLLSTLTASPPKHGTVLVIHSLDHSNLRKLVTQGLLARLAAHPKISLAVSCDTLNFPLLWDVTLSKQFRFLFHDATTFEPYKVELDVVEDVNVLLGRSSRRLGGKDGVSYVLKSLPENARNLFRILVAEQLALADLEGDAALEAGFGADESDSEDLVGVEDEEEAARLQATPSKRRRGRPKKAKTATKPRPAATAQVIGVEYRTLYHKAVEEFVCSSEVNFRTLLKEFHDHQIIESRKDALGTERLIVPFRREELETILEELV